VNRKSQKAPNRSPMAYYAITMRGVFLNLFLEDATIL
jgi:hypothetical protein